MLNNEKYVGLSKIISHKLLWSFPQSREPAVLDLLFWGYVYDLSSNILFTLTSSHKFEEKCWKWKHVVQHKLYATFFWKEYHNTNLAMYHQPTRLECFSVECFGVFYNIIWGKISQFSTKCNPCIFAAVISGACRLVPTKKESSATAAEQCTHCTHQTKMFYGVSYSVLANLQSWLH